MLMHVNDYFFKTKDAFNKIRKNLNQDETVKIEKIIRIISQTIEISKNYTDFDNACKTNLEIIESIKIFDEILPNIAQKGKDAERLTHDLTFLMSGTAGWFFNED